MAAAAAAASLPLGSLPVYLANPSRFSFRVRPHKSLRPQAYFCSSTYLNLFLLPSSHLTRPVRVLLSCRGVDLQVIYALFFIRTLTTSVIAALNASHSSSSLRPTSTSSSPCFFRSSVLSPTSLYEKGFANFRSRVCPPGDRITPLYRGCPIDLLRQPLARRFKDNACAALAPPHALALLGGLGVLSCIDG
jgi:hypothetical protein